MIREINTVEAAYIRSALDTLGVALTEYNHQWSDTQRELYDNAIDILTKIVDDKS